MRHCVGCGDPGCAECSKGQEPRDLLHWTELLQQIAAGLAPLIGSGIGYLEVVLVNGNGKEFEFGVAQVLDIIANDLTWDDRGNWADARIARVQSL